jgi:hypothetical protein
MKHYKLSVPVAFFIFNRPEQTKLVFERIRGARPESLFIIADGPRHNRLDDIEKCRITRQIIDTIDWDCQVSLEFSDYNLGCKRRVASGLDWVFKNNSEAIILEDDCLPDPSFFRYCAELLEKYREDDRVVSISGDNFQHGIRRGPYSYYFSRHPHVWGWASWRRVWHHYDIEMKTWPENRDRGWLHTIFDNPRMARYWSDTFDAVYQGKVDTWDHQWTYNCWRLNGLAALPEVNLISNIGFGLDATHTRRRSPFSAMPTESLEFPLTHPPNIKQHVVADKYTERHNYRTDIVARMHRSLRTWLIK